MRHVIVTFPDFENMRAYYVLQRHYQDEAHKWPRSVQWCGREHGGWCNVAGGSLPKYYRSKGEAQKALNRIRAAEVSLGLHKRIEGRY